MDEKWWMAKAAKEGQYALGSGDVEYAIITGRNNDNARQIAQEMLDALRFYWEPTASKCPGCGQNITTYWAKDNNGCDSRPEYVLAGDCAWHGSCWDKEVAEYNPEP